MKIRNLKKLLIIGLSFFALQAFSLDFVFTNNGYFGKGNAFAIEGFDAVNYFTNDAAAKGNPDFSMQYRGKQWHFKNAQNLAKFKANPEKFAPQYGGHCAWRMAQDGEGVYGDANIWTIVDGKLYLNYNTEVNSRWVKNIPGFISKGDDFWLGKNQFKALN